MKEFSHPGGDGKKPIDLHATIENVITVSSNEWKYVADIETDFDDEVPTVPAYGQAQSSSLLNIIVNAAHAIDARNGGNAKGTITITTEKVGDQVRIRIGDTGSGMPEEVRQRIFDPFFTTKEVGKGTGQGLSIAYASIVDKHGGSLTVESKPDVGTTFEISLPLTDETADSATDAAA
jgi:signal transduction histidine kinase